MVNGCHFPHCGETMVSGYFIIPGYFHTSTGSQAFWAKGTVGIFASQTAWEARDRISMRIENTGDKASSFLSLWKRFAYTLG